MTAEMSDAGRCSLSPGWDEDRVRRLIAELDQRTEEEWIADDEAAATDHEEQTVVTIPTSLLPEVRRLLATHKRD